MKKILFLVISMAFFACGESSEKDPIAFAAEQKRATMKATIDSLEKVMNGNQGLLDKTLANKLVKSYQDYYNMNSSDTTSAEFLFKGANIATAVGKHHQAIKMLEAYYDTFQTAPKRPDALYLIGFIYENGLKDVPNAKKMYNRTIEVYPESFWAEQAKSALALIDLQGDDLIKFLEGQNKPAQ